MNDQTRAAKVAEKMMDEDAFSQLLGMKIESIQPGQAVVSLHIDDRMTNGVGITHGGVTYALADSTFAFASNSRGRVAVAVDTTISYLEAVHSGDTLTATARELRCGKRIGVYEISIENQHQTAVATFKGTVYRTSKTHVNNDS